ncbi:MAG: phenylalanine--tRNA ligase subunit alpha [Candidatus Micrarchaeota archaeon]
MNESETRLLKALAQAKQFVPAAELAHAAKIDYGALMSLAAGLESQRLVEARKSEAAVVELTAEGKEYAAKGTPEKRLAEALRKLGAAPLEKAFEAARLSAAERPIALKWAKQRNWIAVKEGKAEALKREPSAADEVLAELAEHGSRDATAFSKQALDELLSRRLAQAKAEKAIDFRITPAGAKALAALPAAGKEVTQLTPEMLKTGSWRKAEFKPYDVSTVTAPLSIGVRQHYKRFLNQIRQQLVGLGFKEVHGPLVETEFWNMDALFMPQEHPAREIHDVFHLAEPSRGVVQDKALLARVRKAHEEGIAGSIGWQYEWNPDAAHRLVCRSHTTPVSARNLAKKLKPPARLFCIGKVFRPDEIDWKHFIEFNQCEGIVADEGMTFRELLGYLKMFAIEIFGADEARFYPTYFPFTEPSVEMHVRLGEKGWTEVAGAGLFRPEMLEALGVEVPVLAWGLGIDRLAMIKLGLTDIRDLHSQDVEFLKKRVTVP